jgi:cyclic-di-GMP phosphodiesterase TipF (flagellum assembly factor)
VQGLVYIFIALSALAIGAAGRFGLNLSIIESILTGLVFACIAFVWLERMLRARAEARLEQGIEDLARLLSTDAQAGGVLSQRINVLVDQNAGSRLDGLEADISVLGTVVRQVAEAVADIEERKPSNEPQRSHPSSGEPDLGAEPVVAEAPVEPAVSIDALKRAMAESRLIYYVDPILTLPQRRNHGYDLVPRLVEEDGTVIDAADFMPRKGNDAVVRHIEGLGMQEAIATARRASNAGTSMTLYVTLSHASLSDPLSVEQLAVLLEANRAVAGSIVARIDAAVWSEMSPVEKFAVGTMVRKGMAVSLSNATSLRLDFADLASQGVRSIRVDTTRLVDRPESLTDIHSADIVSYVRRANIELIATGLVGERQILSLLDDGIGLAQGPHLAGPGPVRAELIATPTLEGASRRA